MSTAVRVSSVPSITIFVRHSTDCPRKADEFFRACKCPKHLRWSHSGKQFRQSAHTRAWKTAEEVRRKVEAQFESSDPASPQANVTLQVIAQKTIEQVVRLFVTDKRSQGIESDVLKKYERELLRFAEFMAAQSKFFPAEIGQEDLTIFRSGWEKQYPSSTTRAKVQERLRSFLKYCYQAKLIDRIPQLSPIKVDEPPTLPLTQAQYRKLLEVIPNEFGPTKAARVHALVQLMRHSGLSIRDAVTLEQSEMIKGKVTRIVTSRQKTGTHVSIPIPPAIAVEIKKAMTLNENSRFAFWNTGNGTAQTAVTHWQHDLRQVFRAAEMPEGHPHQLRDTFAVSLLENGLPLEEVSKLLGHESIKTTEKYYAKWVQARQDRLDKLVMDTWV